MGEKIKEFRLRTPFNNWARILITLAYFAWAIIFIIVGFQPSDTGAASGNRLSIPSINLETTTKPVSLDNRRFSVPDTSVGSYYANENKIFLMGHKATIFSNLKSVQVGDQITYADDIYTVSSIDIKKKEEIDMSALLAPASNPTLILMTCHGTPLSATDYSHRLIITASKSISAN